MQAAGMGLEAAGMGLQRNRHGIESMGCNTN